MELAGPTISSTGLVGMAVTTLHRYQFPIMLVTDSGEKTTGQFIAEYREPKEPADLEKLRADTEEQLNRDINPLFGGSTLTVKPPAYREIRKRTRHTGP